MEVEVEVDSGVRRRRGGAMLGRALMETLMAPSAGYLRVETQV